ncbi:MAG TPA: anti-sigma factor [Motilibacteraceae bacterium]|nr:anti-sigma factor [Motilibacteraceae bacterium]
MTAADVHTLTGAYAAHALPEDEARAFEAHLAACEACAQEVRELQATTARLALEATATPPPALKRAVLAQVATTRQLPPVVRPADETAAPARQDVVVPLRRRGRWTAPLGIAAAVLLATSVSLGGFLAQQHRDLQQQRATARAVAAVVADPAHTEHTTRLPAGGSVTVVAAGGQAVFTGADLPALPDGKGYQLWVMRASGVTSAGMLPLRSGVTQAYVPDVAGGTALAVSVEPAGGSAQPTTTPVAVVPLV